MPLNKVYQNKKIYKERIRLHQIMVTALGWNTAVV